MATIKFNQFNVTNGTDTAKVFYSLDNRNDGRKAVCLYAKCYDRALGRVLSPEYINDTDSMTDYFDQGRVVLFEDHPLYAVARARAELNNAKFDVKWAAKRAAYDEKMAARRIGVAA